MNNIVINLIKIQWKYLSSYLLTQRYFLEVHSVRQWTEILVHEPVCVHYTQSSVHSQV